MNFITIDFETATSDRNSPCEIGLTIVKDLEIQSTKSWLIKPFGYPIFNYFNIMTHGIKPIDVANEPEFDKIWEEVKPIIENKFLFAHNARFDFDVLQKTLDTYDLAYPTLDYSCSYILSKLVWTGLPSYGLKALCNYNQIDFNHHRAGDDSRATSQLILKAFQAAGISSLDEISEKYKITIGKLFNGGSIPTEAKRISKTGKSSHVIVSDRTKHNPSNIFYDKKVVFTGKLLSMVRKNAQQIIADIGGNATSELTKDTDFLIVGQLDYKVVGEKGISEKQQKAFKMVEDGSNIEIISESEFLGHI